MPFDCTDVLSWVEVIQIDWIKNTNRLPWGFFLFGHVKNVSDGLHSALM